MLLDSEFHTSVSLVLFCFFSGRSNCLSQFSLPSASRVIDDNFNPDHLSGNCLENASKPDTSVPEFPSPNGTGNMVKRSTLPNFDRGISHPGYPITSDNMFGPLKCLMVRKSQKGFGKCPILALHDLSYLVDEH